MGDTWYDNGEPSRTITGTTDLRDGEWHHLAVARAGSIYYGFVDGSIEFQLDNGDATCDDTSCTVCDQDIAIGDNAYNHEGSGTCQFIGNMNGIVITPAAKWTSAFTPAVDWTSGNDAGVAPCPPASDPPQSCKDILNADATSPNGKYWIKPTTTKIQVYCLMQDSNQGGGWTRVAYGSEKDDNHHQTGASRTQELADMYLEAGILEGVTGPGAKLSDADINAIQERHDNYLFVTMPYSTTPGHISGYQALPESVYFRIESCTFAATTVASGNCRVDGSNYPNYNDAHGWVQHHSNNAYHDWWNAGASPGVGALGGGNANGHGPSYMMWAR